MSKVVTVIGRTVVDNDPRAAEGCHGERREGIIERVDGPEGYAYIRWTKSGRVTRVALSKVGKTGKKGYTLL